MWAAENGHADCARVLLDAGADKEVKCKVRASRLHASGLIGSVIGDEWLLFVEACHLYSYCYFFKRF